MDQNRWRAHTRDTPTQVTSPATFTLETWFKTKHSVRETHRLRKAQTGTSAQYDRQLYLSPTGQVIFGTYNGGTQQLPAPPVTLTAPGTTSPRAPTGHDGAVTFLCKR